MVEHIEERRAVVLHRVQQLKGAYGKAVEAHVAFLVDACERRYVAYVRVLGHLEVVEYRPGGHDAAAQMVYAKALERLHAEVL